MLKIVAVLVLGLVLLLAAGAVATALIARAIEARFPPEGRFVPVTGGRLHVLEAGPAGPAGGEAEGTVVLLHGASSNAEDLMVAFGRRLAARHRVIALDRPGHGWSDRIGGAEAASPARQAAVVAEALRALGVERALVVAHSWAGAVGPNLALDHADVTGGLLLLSPVTHPWPGAAISWYYGPATSWLGWLFTRTLTTPVGRLILERTVEAVFAPQAAPPGYAVAARIPLVLRPPVFQANAEDVSGLYAAVAAQSPRYGGIRVPSTVMAGTEDLIVYTDTHARAFAREVPGARLVILPGLGHMPHYAAPDRVVAEVEALLARMRAPDAASGRAGALTP